MEYNTRLMFHPDRIEAILAKNLPEQMKADLVILREAMIINHLCPAHPHRKHLEDSIYRSGITVAEAPRKSLELLDALVSRFDTGANGDESFEGDGLFGFVCTPSADPLPCFVGRIYVANETGKIVLTFVVIDIPANMCRTNFHEEMIRIKLIDARMPEINGLGERIDHLKIRDVISGHVHVSKLKIKTGKVLVAEQSTSDSKIIELKPSAT